MDTTALLLGAGIALGSATLGVVSEALKGWLVRRNTNADKRKAFQHRTAVELQETIYEMMRTSLAMYFSDTMAYRATGQWGRNRAPVDIDEQNRVQRARVNVLLERMEDANLRQNIEAIVSTTAAMMTARSESEANQAHDALMNQLKIVNRELGRIVRESWPD